jgi:hypothetical protein
MKSRCTCSQSAYVQNALSVWLFQYATSTREVLARVDFGVSPAYVCLLAFALAQSARRLGASLDTLYKYVARAWHMLLVEWLIRTVGHSTLGLPLELQIALLAMLIVVVDELCLDRLSLMRDVRGYTVFRIAGELQRLGVLSSDGASAFGAVIVAFGVHTGLNVMRLRSRATSSAADIFLVACTNALLQSASSGGGPAQLMRVGVVCVLAYEGQAALARSAAAATPA